MKSKLFPVSLLGSLILVPQAFSQDATNAPPIAGHVTIPVEKQPLEGTTVERVSVHHEGGRSIVMKKIAPPALPDPPAAPPAPSAEALEQFRARSTDTRPRAIFGLSAATYDNQATYLEWTHEGQRFGAWSNVDFKYLTGASQVEANGTLYYLMIMPSSVSTARLAQAAQLRGKIYEPPTIPTFESTEPTFIVVKGDATDTAALAAVTALHQLYKTEKVELKRVYDQRKADAAAQAEYDRQHPQTPKDTVIQFWKREVPATNEGGAEQ